MNPLVIVGHVGKYLEHHDVINPKIVQDLIKNDSNSKNEIVAVEDIIIVLNLLVDASFIECVSSYGLGSFRRFVPPDLKRRIKASGRSHYQGSTTPQPNTTQRENAIQTN